MTPVSAADFRRLALALPGASEGAHHGVADFRSQGKIFATLAYEHQGFGVLMLTAEEQLELVAGAPEFFSPVPNRWGVKGATRVDLEATPEDVLQGALRMAWRHRAAGGSR